MIVKAGSSPCVRKHGMARAKCEARRAAGFVGRTTLAGAKTMGRFSLAKAKVGAKATAACIKRCVRG